MIEKSNFTLDKIQNVKMHLHRIICFAFLIFGHISFTQTKNKKVIDSLSQLSFNVFEKHFDKDYFDSLTDFTYAIALLKKAKRSNDTILMADAYYYLSDMYSNENRLEYADSIINLTKNLKHYSYPFTGYSQKANFYYDQGKYDLALDFLLKCYDSSLEIDDKLNAAISQQNIGLIKNKIGERKEALKIFRNVVDFLDKNDIKDKDFHLVGSIYALADAYIYNKHNDSAKIAIKRGLEKAIKANDSLMHAHYVYLSGVNYFFTKQYQEAIDSLSRSKLISKDKIVQATANLYLGKSYDAIDKKRIAFRHFVKVDSFLQQTQIITHELLEIYTPLIEYQKEKKNTKHQLDFINRLLKYDSILKEKNKYISKNLVKNYDIPNVIASKNQIINDMEGKRNISNRYITYLIITVVLLLVICIFFINKNYSNKKRFEKIINRKDSKKDKRDDLNDKDKNINAGNSNGLPNEIINSILSKLENFENEYRFLKKHTLISLSNELNTNSNYLSRIINDYKEKNFSSYLNDLRINYAIDRLKEDRKFRKYTIKAIANEVGFNSAESFSKAFVNVTQLKPSYFLKELNKTEV